MGKDSLIKSTSKKKADKKKSTKKVAAKSTKKTVAAKPAKAKKPAAKAQAKSKTAKKAAPKATKKTAAKPVKKAAPVKSAAKKTAPAKKAKKLTVKELLMLKFESTGPAVKKIPAAKAAPPPPSAPPLITSTDPKEVARLRAVLSEKFSMTEIKAAARQPAPLPEPEPVAKPDSPPDPVADAIPPEPREETKPAAPAPADAGAFITTEPPQMADTADPVARTAKIAIGLAVAVVFLLLSISYNNSTKYYISPKDDAIEIWKGRFSPKDNKFFMVLHGTELTDPVKPVYSSKEVFPLIFNYYLEKADTLLEVPGLPDYKGIKAYLHQAKDYAVNTQMITDVNARLDTIERNTVLYKADVAMSKGTVESLQSAIKLLKQAAKLSPSATQADEISAKIAAAGASIDALKAAAKQADKE